MKTMDTSFKRNRELLFRQKEEQKIKVEETEKIPTVMFVKWEHEVLVYFFNSFFISSQIIQDHKVHK